MFLGFYKFRDGPDVIFAFTLSLTAYITPRLPPVFG
jgi:hypothetical protein